MLQAEISEGRMKVSREGQPKKPSDEQSLEIVKAELEHLRLLGLLVG